MFSSSAIIFLAATGLLSVAIPVICAIIFKSRVKTAPVSALFIGAAAFFVFAFVLEQLLHAVMIPLVSKSDIAFVIYGALAAGIFEETGRFVAFKTVLKKQNRPESAVMYGIGHGGCEAVMILGMSALSGIVIAIMVNSVGIDEMIKLASAGRPELEETARLQIEAYAGFGLSKMLLSLYERAMTIALHISLSVLVFEGAKTRGRAWLYPVCVLAHAACDVPSAMYQRGILDLAAVYAVTTVLTAAAAVFAVRSYKRQTRALSEAREEGIEKRFCSDSNNARI